MPAYNFQEQFVPMILDGSKTHTIRRRRKYPTKVGDFLSLYVGQRTKNCRLVAVVPCEKIEKIILFPSKMEILIADDDERGQYREMRPEIIAALARHDGFKSTDAFWKFFERYRDDQLMMEIIHWDPNKMSKFYELGIALEHFGEALRATIDPLLKYAEVKDG